MTQLLVSVRDAAEAFQALLGGAALIDIKDPSRGSLGRPESTTIKRVIEVVQGRVPVSAAMGEWVAESHNGVIDGLAFAKWGVAGIPAVEGLNGLIDNACVPSSCKLVVAAYADYKRAECLPPVVLASWACAHHLPVLLVDTWKKDGQGLLSWITHAELKVLRDVTRQAGVRLALAGALTLADMPVIASVRPDWVAVRGAVCHQTDRNQPIDAARIQDLTTALVNLES